MSNPNNSVKGYKNIKKMIVSPCISICKTDPSTGYCYGCGRNNEEKRLTGWQLQSFRESYSYKIKNGMSLFKKNLIKE